MRTDKHRPAEMDPGCYQYLGWIYQGDSEVVLQALGNPEDDPDWMDHEWLRKDTQLHRGNWSDRGTCDHCGAHFAWGNAYLYKPDQEIVVVGHICAAKFNLVSRMELLQKQIERRAEVIRKRRRIQAQVEKYRQENPLIANILDSNLTETNTFIADVKGKLSEYGSLTERQGAAIIASAIKDYWYQQEKAAREAQHGAAEDVPAGNGLEITGVILSIKSQNNEYGYGEYTYKMLIQDDRGFRVWGTVPGSILGYIEKGSRVKFIANIDQSEDDPKFGFFKRPRKAEVID